MVGGQHRKDGSYTEPRARVNTVQASNRSDNELQNIALVCSEVANTPEKALATADLVRDGVTRLSIRKLREPTRLAVLPRTGGDAE